MSIDVGVLQHSTLRVTYRSSDAEFFSICPRLLLSFDVTHNISPGVSPYALAISNFMGELRLFKEGSVREYVGQLVAKQPFVLLFAGSTTVVTFGLDLSHYELGQIEKLRESKDLELVTNFTYVAEIHQQPQTRTSSGFQLMFRIPKSDWVEKLLPKLGFKSVSLLEIPKLVDSEFAEIINHVEGAWKQYSMGEYHRVLSDCRKALEALGTKVKSKGFEKTIEEEGRKKTLPDWSKLLGNDDLGDIMGTISQKTIGFITPGSHAGKTINKEDADFALMVTHAIVNLTTRKLLMI